MEKTLKDQASLARITGAHAAIDTDLRVVRSQMRELQPRLVEANRISKALSIRVKYSFKLLNVKVPSTKRGKKQGGAEGEGERRVVLQIMAEKSGERKLWTQDKFNRRLVRMVKIADMDEPPAVRKAEGLDAGTWYVCVCCDATRSWMKTMTLSG